jgi:hypothetical protein
MNQWQIGNVKITRVIEMEVTGGSKFILPQATREAVKPMEWLTPHFADEQGNLIMSIHALVIETPTRKMLVDTCIGNDKQRSIPNWTNLQLPFLEDLEKAGYKQEDIDTVMCTHLHVDHVGWNTMLVDGKWIPTFPNARYLMGRKEYEYWDTADADPLNRESWQIQCARCLTRASLISSTWIIGYPMKFILNRLQAIHQGTSAYTSNPKVNRHSSLETASITPVRLRRLTGPAAQISINPRRNRQERSYLIGIQIRIS